MNASLDNPLELLNTYGAFGSVTKVSRGDTSTHSVPAQIRGEGGGQRWRADFVVTYTSPFELTFPSRHSSLGIRREKNSAPLCKAHLFITRILPDCKNQGGSCSFGFMSGAGEIRAHYSRNRRPNPRKDFALKLTGMSSQCCMRTCQDVRTCP